MNEKLKIGIDLDDVVFDFVPALLDSLEKNHDKRFTFEEVVSYYFPSLFELSLEEILKLVSNLDLENFNLCSGAKQSIFKLSDKYKIYFITSRVFQDGTLQSLKTHFSNLDFELIFSSNPYVKTKGKTKGEICKELEINFMVEDSKEHAEICAEEGIKTFLLDKPWNRNCKNHENIIKVKDWGELLEILK